MAAHDPVLTFAPHRLAYCSATDGLGTWTMSLDDDSQPRSDATQGLPASASYRLRVARRPTAARIITAVGALLGGLIAACVTVVATSGVCLDGQANCYGLGEQSASRQAPRLL